MIENRYTSREAPPDGLDLGEPIRISVRSDLLPGGEFGEEWLVVTDSRVLVAGRDGEGVRVRWESPLTELSEPKAEGFVGKDIDDNRYEIPDVAKLPLASRRFLDERL